MEKWFLNKITFRGFKLGLVMVGVSYFAYLTIKNPSVWAINLVIWPIAALIIFDRGHARAIDEANRAVKHLKGRSEQADLMLYLLSSEKLRLAKTKLLILKHDFPNEKEALEIAANAIDSYLEKKPWWHI